jgi:hypothetical protein
VSNINVLHFPSPPEERGERGEVKYLVTAVAIGIERGVIG